MAGCWSVLLKPISSLEIARLELDVTDEGDVQNVQWWGRPQDRFEKHRFS